MTRRKKASAAPPTMQATPWDQGATGPANLDGMVTQERGDMDLTTGKRINPNRVFGKVRMPIFMRYMRQGRITPEHAAAAQRIYAAYAGHPTRDPLAAITDRVDGGGTPDPNVALIDQRREFYQIKAMIPVRCWKVVEHVVVEDLPIRSMTGGSNPEIFAAHLARLVTGLEAVK
jgi:hypothetical protein